MKKLILLAILLLPGAVQAQLTLSDYNLPTGRQHILLMLITAGGSGTSIYREGVIGTLEAGSDAVVSDPAGVLADQTLNRFRDNGNRVTVNGSGPGWRNYFQTAGGPFLDADFYITDSRWDSYSNIC